MFTDPFEKLIELEELDEKRQWKYYPPTIDGWVIMRGDQSVITDAKGTFVKVFLTKEDAEKYLEGVKMPGKWHIKAIGILV